VLTLTSGIVGWLLITRSLPHLPASASALILLLEPVGAIILGAIVLSQRPSLLQMAGAVLVCGGVLVVATGQAKTEMITARPAALSTSSSTDTAL